MKCRNCDIEMFAEDGGVEVRGDKSPEEETEVYSLQSFRCRNKQCQSYGKVVHTEAIKIYPLA